MRQSPDEKIFARKRALIRGGRIALFSAFVLFFPATIAASVLGFGILAGVAPVWLLMCVGAPLYMYARCPRCKEPVHYDRSPNANPFFRFQRARNIWWSKACIHCGWSFSASPEGYTKSDFLGPSAMPIYARFKGLLKAVGAGAASVLIGLFACQNGFSHMHIAAHIVMGIIEYASLIGLYELVIGVPFTVMMRNLRFFIGWRRTHFIIAVPVMLLLTPVYTWLIAQLVGRLS